MGHFFRHKNECLSSTREKCSRGRNFILKENIISNLMLRHNTYTKRDHGKRLYYITQSIVLELKIRLLLEQNPEEIKTGYYFNLSLTYIKPLFRGVCPWKHSKHLSKQYPKFHKLTTSLFSSTISINGITD